jgi:hypothetical protein
MLGSARLCALLGFEHSQSGNTRSSNGTVSAAFDLTLAGVATSHFFCILPIRLLNSAHAVATFNCKFCYTHPMRLANRCASTWFSVSVRGPRAP